MNYRNWSGMSRYERHTAAWEAAGPNGAADEASLIAFNLTDSRINKVDLYLIVISCRVGLVKRCLSLLVHSVRNHPKVVLLNRVLNYLIDLLREALVVEEGDIRESIFEEVVVEG